MISSLESTRIGGLHVRAALESAGAAVVLVHGLVVSGRYMMPLARHLGPHYRVYVPDLPGHGLSPPPPRVLSVPELAEALGAFLDAAGLERPHLYGNSMGCQIVAHLAARHPGRVGRLVLQGPTSDPTARTFARQFWRWSRDGKWEPLAEFPHLLRDYRDIGLRRGLAEIRHFLRDRPEDVFPLVRAPTLVIRGGRDPIVPRRWAEEVVRLLPDARLHEIPGIGHAANFSAPLELRRILRPFFDAARGA